MRKPREVKAQLEQTVGQTHADELPAGAVGVHGLARRLRVPAMGRQQAEEAGGLVGIGIGAQAITLQRGMGGHADDAVRVDEVDLVKRVCAHERLHT